MNIPQTPSKKSSAKNLTTSPVRKAHYAFYASNVYSKNKLKCIIHSCGVKFAHEWARVHRSELVLSRLLK